MGGEVNRAVGIASSKFQPSYHFMHKYFTVSKRNGMGLLFNNEQTITTIPLQTLKNCTDVFF